MNDRKIMQILRVKYKFNLILKIRNSSCLIHKISRLVTNQADQDVYEVFFRKFFLHETAINQIKMNIVKCFLRLCLIYHLIYPAGNYKFKVDNRNTRARRKICSKLTIKRPVYFKLKFL